jgi:hypothetical protein
MLTIPPITWLTWLGIVSVVAALTILYSRRINLRWLPSLVLVTVVASGTLAGLYLIRSYVRPTPATVTVSGPMLTELTGTHLRLRGTVTPAQSRVTVVVRSETDQRWWVQSVVSAENDGSGAGRWAIDAVIGSAQEGNDENFQIVALASADSFAFNLITGRFLFKGNTLRNMPQWQQSEPIVVRRVYGER